MRKISQIFILIVSALSLALPVLAEDAAPAEESALTLDTSLSFYSKYMWRGFNLYDGDSIQPSVTLSHSSDLGTFSLNGWMHLSPNSDEELNEFTELDLTPAYEISFDKLTVGGGVVFYLYPGDEPLIDDTREFFFTASYDTVLSPSVSFYRDFDVYDSNYLELGLSHTIEVAALGDGFSFTPAVTLGFADDAEAYYADDGLVQVTYGVSMEAPLGDLTITPEFNYTQGEDEFTSDEFWFGVTLSHSL